MDPVIAHNPGNLLQLVESSAFVGFWRLDARSGTLYWSQQMARLHGAPPGYTPPFENALAHYAAQPGAPPGYPPPFENALAHYADEHRAELEARVRACQERGEPFDIEVQVQ